MKTTKVLVQDDQRVVLVDIKREEHVDTGFLVIVPEGPKPTRTHHIPLRDKGKRIVRFTLEVGDAIVDETTEVRQGIAFVPPVDAEFIAIQVMLPSVLSYIYDK